MQLAESWTQYKLRGWGGGWKNVLLERRQNSGTSLGKEWCRNCLANCLEGKRFGVLWPNNETATWLQHSFCGMTCSLHLKLAKTEDRWDHNDTEIMGNGLHVYSVSSLLTSQLLYKTFTYIHTVLAEAASQGAKLLKQSYTDGRKRSSYGFNVWLKVTSTVSEGDSHQQSIVVCCASRPLDIGVYEKTRPVRITNCMTHLQIYVNMQTISTSQIYLKDPHSHKTLCRSAWELAAS